MIAGGRQINVDLSQLDFAVWLKVMSVFREHYGDRLFVTESPGQPNPMQSVVNNLARAAKVYREFPGPGPIKRDAADERGSASGLSKTPGLGGSSLIPPCRPA